MSTYRKRPNKFQRGVANVWKRIVPNLNFRWIAPWWFSEFETGDALLQGRVAQYQRETPAVLHPTIVFIWVPKAAGTSLFKVLEKSVGMAKLNVVPEIISQSDDELSQVKAVTFGHLTTDSLFDLGVLGSDELENAFTFGFVRNPFTRATSLFHYLRRQRAIPNLWSFNRFLRAIESEKPSGGLWNVVGLSQAAPMVDWMRPKSWRGPNLVLRYEDIPGSMKLLSKSIPVPQTVPHLNPSRGSEKALTISPRAVDFIRDFYREDFASFDYSTEPPEGLFRITKG